MPRRRTRRRKSDLRLTLLLIVIVCAAGVVIAAWAWMDIRSVESEVTAVRLSLQQAVDDPGSVSTPERRAATRAQFNDAVRRIDAARQRLAESHPVSVAGLFPGLSRQRVGLLTLLDDAGVAAVTGRNLLGEVESVATDNPVRDGSVPFAGLNVLAADVRAAGRELGALARSPEGLWGSLADARSRFNEMLRSNSTRLLGGAEALQTAQSFMGATRDRRYLVAAQNNAEMRDQGMVLSYSIVDFADGRVSVEPGGSVGGLALEEPAPTPVPPDSEQVFGFLQPNKLWQSVNATADFSWSGRAMADMYRQATGQSVDGVIAIDIPGLAALLRVVGPVEVPDIAEPVTAENAGRILLHDLYQGLAPWSDQGPRRERLSEVTEAVVTRIKSGTFDVITLGRELGYAAAGGHLKAWSSDPAEQSVFERTGVGGSPASSNADRTFHLAVQNRTATKLDYFVKPAVRLEVELTDTGDAVVRTTVAVDNQAPVGQPPSYQLGPDGITKEPGEYTAWLLLWGPAGAFQQGATPDSGLLLSQQVAHVGPSQSRELVFETVIPRAVRDGKLTLRLVPQPRLEPMRLQVDLKAPEWHVSGPDRVQLWWDRAVSISWSVDR